MNSGGRQYSNQGYSRQSNQRGYQQRPQYQSNQGGRYQGGAERNERSNERGYVEYRQGQGIQQKMRDQRNQQPRYRNDNMRPLPPKQQQQNQQRDNGNRQNNQQQQPRRTLDINTARREFRNNNAYRRTPGVNRAAQGGVRRRTQGNINPNSKRIMKTRDQRDPRMDYQGGGGQMQQRGPQRGPQRGQMQENYNRPQQQRQQRRQNPQQQRQNPRQQQQQQQLQQRPPRNNSNPNPNKVSATGIPFSGPLKLPPLSQLKALQVKAELQKLGDAPRAYIDKLLSDGMSVDVGYGGRLSLTERFEKIQGARPGSLNVINPNRRPPPPTTQGAPGKTLRLIPRPRQTNSRRYAR